MDCYTWTQKHWPTSKNLQLFVATECCLEDLARMMDDREKWCERAKEMSTCFDDDDDNDDDDNETKKNPYCYFNHRK